jgi:hypothetical protein
MFGVRSGGEVVVGLGKCHLWEGQNWKGGELPWEDFDSDEFPNWVKSKTKNGRAEITLQ